MSGTRGDQYEARAGYGRGSLAAVLAGLLACASAACTSNPVDPDEGGIVDAGQQRDAGGQPEDGGTEPAGIVDTGPQYLDACKSFNSQCQDSTDPNCGKCQYRIRFDSRNCSRERPCDNLFMLFAFSGCEGPKTKDLLDTVLAGNPDFAAVCVQPIYPGEVLPVSLGAPERENVLLPHVLNLLKTQESLGVWSGKNLLMGGCSAGASRYPVIAARYADDDAWVGSEKTGACFGDGVVALAFQDQFIGQKVETGATCAYRHARMITAYTRSEALPGHSCAASPQGQCACDPEHSYLTYPGDCGEGDCVEFDSIMRQEGTGFVFAPGLSAASFAVPHWKLISEGSSWAATDNRCDNDVCPEGPFRALCQAIDADPAMDCAFVSKPEERHCEYYLANLDSLCVDWFRAL